MRPIFLILSSLIAFIVSGCGQSSPVQPETAFGQISLRISMPANSPFKTIAKTANVAVSGSDMATIVKSLAIGDSTIDGSVNQIPSGESRLFQVNVFDSMGTARYSGSATSDVLADSIVTLVMEVTRLVGAVEINGTIKEWEPDLVDDATMAAFQFNEGMGSLTKDSKANITGSIFNGAWEKNANGYGIAFNGNNTYITTSSNSTISLRDTFTIDIIFRAESTSERRFLFGMRQPQDVSAEIREDGKFRAILQGGNGSTHLVSKRRMDDGAWHSVSIVHTKGVSTLYCDGAKQMDSVNVNLGIQNNTSVLIGHLQLAEFPGKFFFKGTIDLIRFSNSARTEEEIQRLASLAATN